MLNPIFPGPFVRTPPPPPAVGRARISCRYELLNTAEQLSRLAPASFTELQRFTCDVCRKLEDMESSLSGQPASVTPRNALQVLDVWGAALEHYAELAGLERTLALHLQRRHPLAQSPGAWDTAPPPDAIAKAVEELVQSEAQWLSGSGGPPGPDAAHALWHGPSAAPGPAGSYDPPALTRPTAPHRHRTPSPAPEAPQRTSWAVSAAPVPARSRAVAWTTACPAPSQAQPRPGRAPERGAKAARAASPGAGAAADGGADAAPSAAPAGGPSVQASIEELQAHQRDLQAQLAGLQRQTLGPVHHAQSQRLYLQRLLSEVETVVQSMT